MLQWYAVGTLNMACVFKMAMRVLLGYHSHWRVLLHSGSIPALGLSRAPFCYESRIYINNQEARVVLGALIDGTRRKPDALRPYARELARGSTREVREKAGLIAPQRRNPDKGRKPNRRPT